MLLQCCVVLCLFIRLFVQKAAKNVCQVRLVIQITHNAAVLCCIVCLFVHKLEKTGGQDALCRVYDTNLGFKSFLGGG